MKLPQVAESKDSDILFERNNGIIPMKSFERWKRESIELLKEKHA